MFSFCYDVDTIIVQAKLQKRSCVNMQVTYLEPGESSEIENIKGSQVKIQATAGPVLGPPWQRPENGYFFPVHLISY